jgi:hypothetical protein
VTKLIAYFAGIALLLLSFGLAYWYIRPAKKVAPTEVRLLVPKRDIGPNRAFDLDAEFEEKRFPSSVLTQGGPYVQSYSEMGESPPGSGWKSNRPLYAGEPVPKASLSKVTLIGGPGTNIGPNEVALTIRFPGDPSKLIAGQLVRMEGTVGEKKVELADLEVLAINAPPSAPGKPLSGASITVRAQRSDLAKAIALRTAKEYRIVPQESALAAQARMKLRQLVLSPSKPATTAPRASTPIPASTRPTREARRQDVERNGTNPAAPSVPAAKRSKDP